MTSSEIFLLKGETYNRWLKEQMTKRSMCQSAWDWDSCCSGTKKRKGDLVEIWESPLFGVGEGWAPCDKEVTIVSHRPYLPKPPPKNGQILQQCSTTFFNACKAQAWLNLGLFSQFWVVLCVDATKIMHRVLQIKRFT
jgi:hypothetical protein